MYIAKLLAELRQERDKIVSAIQALERLAEGRVAMDTEARPERKHGYRERCGRLGTSETMTPGDRTGALRETAKKLKRE
jgi:hypothetical protein